VSHSLKTDVMIAGGRMVGLPLALALAQGGLSVVVADAAPPAAALDPDFDGRVSALAYASVRMLTALGVWEGLAPHAQPIREILVSDGKADAPASPFSLHFDAGELSAASLGHIAENRHIRRALHESVARQTNLTLLAPASVTCLAAAAGGMTALLADGGTVGARLVIAADGRASPLRGQMGIGTVGWSYPQTGIVATVEHEYPHHGVAYEHFLPAGPLAILPMPPAASREGHQINRASLVWTEAKAKAPAMLALDEARFNDEIARRFGPHLGATRAAGPRWSYPLAFHIARRFVGERFALAGDAAHGIHPIAGQGLNLGLKDAAALADVLLDAARLGQDIGAADVLRRYERWRRFDSVTLAASTDALNRLFSNDIAPLRLLRDVGLGLVDAIGPARRFFMRHAGGDVGKLPRLMRGEAA
jgi:2-octaprenyl-6-methoxyphenol hydroxylase